ncbi:accessory Sec system protein Asp1 [Gryllotalpicola daejeonensis]|uniref:Accessory Sec system protein Asp1 n=1 Tax=Gryllotalpicola daejeonensis TaxID=993087 RepID=A0ABP7ZFX4_9MICO
MIHFIPAWYNAERRWYSTDRVWFSTRGATESDDTVTQLRVFRQGSEEARLIVLNYVPSLRRFLHSQNIFDVPYWSFFDEVQGLTDDYTRPIDFLELEWPEDVSFHYNPFIVTVMRESEVYARVYLSKDGTLQSIRFYGAGMPALERIYDDRGFLSSVLMHDEAGQPMTQYYLSRGGDVIVSEDVPTGRIDVVQNEGERFRHPSYDNWEALMAEFLGAHLGARDGEHDTVVVAVSEQHNELVTSLLTDQTLVLSRSAARQAVASGEVIQRAGAVFAGVGQRESDAGDPLDDWALLPVVPVYPLERRPTFGASANEAKVYISLFVDDIPLDELDYAIAMSAGQLVGDDHTRLLVCTFRSQDLDFLREVRRVIAGYQHLDTAFFEADEIAALGVDVGIAEEPEEKIQLTFIDREADLTQTMIKSRVLVDLGETVNHRLATEAVNAGVPQINRYEQELVTHPINGFVIGDISELATALEYFLEGLEHWNQSLVQCRVLQDLFRAQEVLDRWDLIREAVAYAGPSDRA